MLCRACRVRNLDQVLVALNELHAQRVREPHQGDLVGAARLELANRPIMLIWVDGSDVVAECEGCHCITDNVLLLTAHLATFPSASCRYLSLESRLAGFRVEGKVIHGADASVLAVLFQERLHVFEGVEVELGPLHGHLLENHVVLGQSARLVR